MACDPSKCKMCQSIVDWKLGKRAARIKSGGHDAGCPMLGLGARDKQADRLREKLIADYVTTINNDDATVGAAAEEQPQQPPPPPPPPPPPQPPPPSQPSRRAEQRAEAGRATAGARPAVASWHRQPQRPPPPQRPQQPEPEQPETEPEQEQGLERDWRHEADVLSAANHRLGERAKVAERLLIAAERDAAEDRERAEAAEEELRRAKEVEEELRRGRAEAERAEAERAERAERAESAAKRAECAAAAAARETAALHEWANAAEREFAVVWSLPLEPCHR
jgi:hypothetical protein